MSCSHIFGGNPPRSIFCQSERLRVVVGCPAPTYLWTPGGATIDEVDLLRETVHEVEVDCGGCGGVINEEFCMPIAYNRGCEPDPSTHFFDDCTVLTSTVASIEVEYDCVGDLVDPASMEFDYTRIPAAITAAYTSYADPYITTTVTISDWTGLNEGTYYIPFRVPTVAGVFSPWALMRVELASGVADGVTCCE